MSGSGSTNPEVDSYSKYRSGVVVITGSGAYSCMLNFTDLKRNKNKFYTMQLIKYNLRYIHFIRYGRIGEPGKVIERAYETEIEGIHAFHKQFKAKTGNNWLNRKHFEPQKGRYHLVDLLDSDTDSPLTPNVKDPPKSKLSPSLQLLLTHLVDLNQINRGLKSMKIDFRQFPLGKMTMTQLQRGGSVLQVLRNLIHQKQNLTMPEGRRALTLYGEIIELSNQYYLHVPVATGRKRPPHLDTVELVDKQYELIDELTYLIRGNQLASQPIKPDVNPLDSVYRQIKNEITPINTSDPVYTTIREALINTHAPTHKFTLKLLNLYSVSRKGEIEAYQKHGAKIGNEELLCHGSRTGNWLSILKNGLLLDPSRLGVHITGKMFGYGVYFTNSFSKSAQYCGVKPGEKGVSRPSSPSTRCIRGSGRQRQSSSAPPPK